MPIYAYRCEACGFAKDALQKISDPVLTECPQCGKSAFKKQLTAAGFQLKGTGWYVTDFRGGQSKKPGESSEPGASAESAREGAAKQEAGGSDAAPATSSATSPTPATTAAPSTPTKPAGTATATAAAPAANADKKS